MKVVKKEDGKKTSAFTFELTAPKEVMDRELFQFLIDVRKLAESRGFEVKKD